MEDNDDSVTGLPPSGFGATSPSDLRMQFFWKGRVRGLTNFSPS